jgi:actin-related protein 3
MDFNSKVVVIDNGTGYTKMGYAGNTEPSFDIPTLITDCGDTSTKAAWTVSNRKITETLDFTIGDDAKDLYRSQKVVNPI